MIDRYACGLLPPKPHTTLRTSEGVLLYEELLTREGFDGPFTYFYHLRPITAARSVERSQRGWAKPELDESGLHPLKRRLYDASSFWHDTDREGASSATTLDGRVPLLFNDDLVVLLARPVATDDVYFANNDGDELWYVRAGSVKLESLCGWLSASEGDYVLVPRSLLHRWHPQGPGLEMLCIEARNDIGIPREYRNSVGQLTMMAPYTHRDFRRPEGPIATLQGALAGPKTLVIKKGDRFTQLELEDPPMDAVGWEGTAYPIVFPILNFQPKTGQLHLPPTVHMTFAGKNYMVGSFVPRLLDYHEHAVPSPYPHANVHCDEVLLYLRGNFTSRRGVGPGAISLHPSGVSHGPHPGAYEGSVGVARTDELAVMLDVFKPLLPTKLAVAIEKRAYHDSWRTAP